MQPSLFENVKFLHPVGVSTLRYGVTIPLEAQTERLRAIEKGGRHLCATVIYRALLDSILRRGQTKTYAYGVRYLRKLDLLVSSISDWQSIEPHAVYKANLQQNHGRKSSFWSRYGA